MKRHKFSKVARYETKIQKSDVRHQLKKLQKIQFSRYLKVCFMLLGFYWRPTLVPVFTNWKKSEEDFCFYEMVIASSLYTILAYEKFRKNALLWIVGETCKCKDEVHAHGLEEYC